MRNTFNLSKELPGRNPAFSEDEMRGTPGAGLYRMVHARWVEPENPKVMYCVHGLTRIARDFLLAA